MGSSQTLKTRFRWISLAIALFVGSAASVGVWKFCSADLTGPTATDHNITNIVTLLMQDQHLARRPLNDEVSTRAFNLFIKGLDPLKLYFYQSDIEEFGRYENYLDDMLKKNDTSFAYVVFKRFLKRVDERVAMVNEVLGQELDFTVDEFMVTDADLRHYATSETEALDFWRQRIKYDLLVLKSEETEGDEAVEKLQRRYKSFGRRMKQFDNDELLEAFLTAFTTSFDPHTNYMSPTSLDNFRIALGLKLEGIGAQLQDRDGKTIVAKVVPGGAADKNGKLKEEDEIVSVGQGKDGEMVDIVGEKLNDVVKKIRGDAGTIVRLGVIPTDGTEVVIYEIIRAKIELDDSAAQGEVFEIGSKPDGTPYKLGVIDLPSFYMDMEGARSNQRDFRSTTRDVKKILEKFKSESTDAVVLDLRRNGGGSLTEAINLTGLFIDEGPVVQVKGIDNRVQHYDDLDPGMAWDGPLVVLTSKFSASASEILAGAIQDYKRGLIVGDEATHGKGTVQSLLDLGSQLIGGPEPPNLGALKITMQLFFRPNGDSTQRRGVLSDVVLPSITNYMDVSESDLDYAIDFQRVRRTPYNPVDLVSPDLLSKLRSQSDTRRRQSEDFAKLLKRIESYRKQKAKKQVVLNEEKFFAERAELNAQKEDEKTMEEQVVGNGNIKRDYYLDEVFSLTVDYVKELKQNKFARAN